MRAEACLSNFAMVTVQSFFTATSAMFELEHFTAAACGGGVQADAARTRSAAPAPASHPRLVAAARTGRIISMRSEEHTSELQSLMRISYAVFCLKKKKKINIMRTTSN